MKKKKAQWDQVITIIIRWKFLLDKNKGTYANISRGQKYRIAGKFSWGLIFADSCLSAKTMKIRPHEISRYTVMINVIK